MSKRLTIKQFAEAYKIMKARGWVAAAGMFCNKSDKQVCPIAALIFASRKTLPRNPSSFNYLITLEKRFGVSEDYGAGIVAGVDGRPAGRTGMYERDEFKAGHTLGRKLYAKFIQYRRTRRVEAAVGCDTDYSGQAD